MTTGQDDFDLTGAISSADLARMERRILFLEAALVQAMREERDLREWFSAGELVAMQLPGLPTTRSGLARMASHNRWETSIGWGRGGEQRHYHFTSLPRQAFIAFIDLVLADGLREQQRKANPLVAAQPTKAAAIAQPAAQIPERAAPSRARGTRSSPPSNTTPQWVLPLMRMMKGEDMALGDAVELLPRRAPGVTCPTLREAHDMLSRLGLLAG